MGADPHADDSVANRGREIDPDLPILVGRRGIPLLPDREEISGGIAVAQVGSSETG